MLSKKSRISLLVVALLLSVTFLFLLQTKDLKILPTFGPSVWISNITSSEYYVLDAKWLEKWPEFKKLLDDSLQQAMLKTGVKTFVENVIETHHQNFNETYQKELEASLKEEATKHKFDNDVTSFKLEEELRAQYLKDNGQLLKNEIIKTFLHDTTDDVLRHRIEEMDTLTIDRSKYFLGILDAANTRFRPLGQGLRFYGKDVPLNGIKEVTSPTKSRKFLTHSRVRIDENDLKDLKEKHDGVVAFLRGLSVPPMEIYSGDGILFAAGKRHMIGVLNVIVQLREMGLELPIEVVLDTNGDYKKHYCETVLPKFNAKCLVIEDILGPEIYLTLEPEGFPMKAFALVLLSFDNTIYLDSDTFPIQNVDALLTCEPFLETRFVLWPDNWHKGTSPLFYDIARLTPGEIVRRDGLWNNEPFSLYITRDRNSDVLFHDFDGIPPFTSVESGQLVFSKREHFRSLFLALYYNLHGSSYYYHLLFQGVFGLGDRETFVPALHVMKEPYYLTDWPVLFTGVMRTKPKKPEVLFFDESTMVQVDPVAAMKFRRAWRAWLLEKGLDSRLNPFQDGEYTHKLMAQFLDESKEVTKPKLVFLHVHSPKINSLYNQVAKKSKFDYKSRFIRMNGEYEDILGTHDWELKFQTINVWSTCEAMDDESFWSPHGIDRHEFCQKWKDYVEILKQDSTDLGAAEVKVLQELGN